MNTNNHLTDDQIDDYLIGDLATDAAAHLAACDICTTRVAEAEAPIASFKAVSLAWSERRSATLPLATPPRVSRWGQRLAWASAMTAALVMGITIPVMRHDSHAATASQPKAATFQMATTGPLSSLTDEQQIDNDNQLLGAMQQHLSVQSDAPSLLQPVNDSAQTRAHRVQD